MSNTEEILTLKQACHILNCHSNTLRKWADEGKIPSIRFGKRGDRRFKKSDVLKKMERYIPEQDERLYYESRNEVLIPLRGTASCGSPSFYAQDNVEDYISVDKGLIKDERGRYYFLRTSGLSMARAGINDSSLALVFQKDSYENGEDVVAVQDGVACIKRLYKGATKVMLVPVSDDPSYGAIIADEDTYIVGKVIWTISMPNNDEVRYVPLPNNPQ